MNALAQPPLPEISEPLPSIDAEWTFLLAACSVIPAHDRLFRLRQLLRTPLRWKAIFELADRHGVQPLLYQAMSGIGQEIPAEALRAAKQAFQANLHKAMLLSRELIRIVSSLRALDIDVMPYKGPSLAEMVYGDLAMRQSGDIDLLIQPRDVSRAREAIRELGYEPHLKLSAVEERAYLKSGYELAFDGPGGPNLLEMQWAILPRFYAVDFDLPAMWDRATTISVAGREMKSLAAEDLMLVLSVHAAKHVWGKLVWLSDIAQLVNTPGLDWKQIGSRARQLGIVRIMQVTLSLAENLLGLEIPMAARQHFGKDRAAEDLAQQLAARIAEGESATESIQYFRLMMSLREHRRDRIRFAWRLLLTPGPNEWKTARLPEFLFPLYRAVRLWRVSRRLSGA